MSFPTTPTNGQVTVVNQVSYQYSSATNSWTRILSTANVITANTIAVNGALTVGTTISAIGNITGAYYFGNGSQLTGITADAAGFPITAGTSNIAAAANSNIAITVGGTANVAVFATTGEYITGVLSANGTVTGGNLVTGGFVTATGNVQGGNLLTGGLVSATGTVTGSTLIGSVVTASGNVTGGNINTGGLISATSTITSGANITGGNLLTGGLISATSTITSAANITGGNVLTGGLISATSDITGGNLLTGGSVSATANITGGNLLTAGLVSATSTITSAANISGGNLLTAGLVSATGNVSGNYILGNGSQLTGIDATSIQNGTSNVRVVSSGGNVSIGIGGTSNVAVFATTGEYITGVLSVSGNTTGGNLLTGGLISATGTVTGSTLIGSVVTASGNVTGGNVLTGGLISATSDITGGNLATGGFASATGNVTGGNINTGGLVTATGNISGGNIATSGIVTASGNVFGNNIFATTSVSTAGNVIAGNVNTSAIQPTSGALTVSTASGDINLNPAGNIVLSSGNTYINNLAQPVQNQDAATKLYVDNIATTGITYHEAVYVATTANLATTTGGTITYAQPNGAANGVGATLTTTTSFNLIDTGNVQTVGTRILVKDQGNAVQNGIYTWANSTALVRSTDADQYGANSVSEISINDYFFTTNGNVNAGTAFIVDAPAGTITFGTSNIGFAIFSQSPVYSANTAAGLSLTGTVFSAKVDNTTTAFDGGGNIIVKASANLTTPNIGAATGTSLNLTGNIDPGNVNTGGLVTATGNVTGGNILTGGLISATGTVTGSTLIGSVVTASGNVTGGNVLTGGLISATSTITSAANITGGNLLTGGLISATANITGGNLISSGQISAAGNVDIGTNYYLGNGAFLTGVITSVANINNGTSNVSIYAANANVAVSVGGTSNVAVFATTGEYINGLLSVSGNVTGGNVLTGGLISSTGTITSAANISGGNLLTGGLISATANITGGNVLTGGLISATANITGGNLITVGLITTSGNIAGGNILSNNYFYANGTPVPPGIIYTANTAPPTTPNPKVTDQWYNTSTDVLYEYLYDGTSNYWVDISSPAFAGGVVANVAISGSLLVNANAVYDIGSSSQSFANVYAVNYYGNGASLSGIITSVSNINNGSSNVTVNGSGGNVTTSVGGTSNVMVVTPTLVSITGDLSVSGNATLSGNILGDRIQNGTTQIDIQTPNGNANITVNGTSNTAVFSTTALTLATNFLPSANITYDLGSTSQRWKDLWLSNSTIYLGNAQISANATSLVFTNPAGGETVLAGASAGVTGATVSATGNITGGNLTTAGILTVNSGAAATAIVNGASNAVGNIGSASTYFNRLFAQATTALYADLAENYLGDDDYTPGTVVDFGGTQEITISTVDSSKRVAGVVSTNPAHLMNAGVVGEHVVTVALIGRVPVSVTGTVRKGDLMVSAGDGTAKAVTIASPKVGTIIGKSLEDFDGDKGTIEIVIGKH
jgi:hypothetical protein